MKRFFLVIAVVVIACGSAFGQSSDPIASAMEHASEDGDAYRATGWGAMAFGASVLLSPLLGGGGVIIVANVAKPDVDLPSARLSSARDSFGSGEDVMLYRSQYEESMEDPIQRNRSRRAWIGTGIGFGVNLVLVSILLANL